MVPMSHLALALAAMCGVSAQCVSAQSGSHSRRSTKEETSLLQTQILPEGAAGLAMNSSAREWVRKTHPEAPFALLTTLFVGKYAGNAHTNELYSAVAENMLNPLIREVH